MTILRLDLEYENIDFQGGIIKQGGNCYLYIKINTGGFSSIHFRLGMSKEQFENLKRTVNAID